MNLTKTQAKKCREPLARAKNYDDVNEIVGSWTGEDEFREIVAAIEARSRYYHHQEEGAPVDEMPLRTPPGTANPEPPGSGAPFGPSNERIPLPSLLSGHGLLSPTPTHAQIGGLLLFP